MRRVRHDPFRASEYHHAASSQGKAVGQDTGMEILASAMRHSVGRPAMGMEGGTKPMERPARRRLARL